MKLGNKTWDTIEGVKMAITKKNPKNEAIAKPTVTIKDMNSQAREEFLMLIKVDTTLNQTWKDTLTPLVSEKIPDDLSPLQDLIDGVPNAETQATQN